MRDWLRAETWWALTKDWISSTAHLSHWSLHVVVGLTVFAATSALFRNSWPSWWLLAPVAVLEAANEVSDLSLFWLAGDLRHWYPSYTAVEIGLTLGPDVAILAMARRGRTPDDDLNLGDQLMD